jgi:uncharacterized protein YdaU (DUF1376 family)
MPLYWGDYLRDTGHLDATQHGFYLLLIGHYWTTGKPLPDDDAKLWRIARADSIDHWKAHRTLIAEFFSIGDGEWKHARIAEELDRATEKRTAYRERAEYAASKRWAKPKQSQKDALSMPQAMLEECPPAPAPPNSVSNETDTADAASVIFNEGLRWLLAKSARPESYCRSQLGKWRKTIGDAALIEALGAGQREGAMDPMGFMERAVAARAPGKRKPWEKPAKADLPPAEPWEKRMADWRKDGFWNTHSAGPRPGEPGCRVPAAFLDNSPRYSATEAA